MKFSTRSRYGLQIMLELAYHFGKSPIHLKEIANNQDISLKYLEQLVMPLRVANLVTNIRGSGGGYTLTRQPGEISLLEIVQILEGPIYPVSCVEDQDTCDRAGQCSMQEVWEGVKGQVEDVLKNQTLQDLHKKQLQYDGSSPRPIKRQSKNK